MKQKKKKQKMLLMDDGIKRHIEAKCNDEYSLKIAWNETIVQLVLI